MGTIFTDVCKHSPSEISHGAICRPWKQKPKQAGPLPGVPCMGLASFSLFSFVWFPWAEVLAGGQGVWWAVFVILWVSSHVMWDVGTSRAMRVLGAQGSTRTFTLSAMRIKCSCTGKSLGDRGSQRPPQWAPSPRTSHGPFLWVSVCVSVAVLFQLLMVTHRFIIYTNIIHIQVYLSS